MNKFHKYFLCAVAVFILAASTGAFLRFGILYGMAGLNYANVRHAHSHLMYFGWVTPAIIAMMAAQMPKVIGRPLSARFGRFVPLLIALGLLAYVPFLLFGYRSVAIGDAQMPVAVIAASLNVMAWWGFAVVYWRQVAGAPPTRVLRLWNAAVLFLLLSTIGTIGLPIVTFARVEDPFWSVAFTHVFLDLFSEGWFVLGILGLAYAAIPDAAKHPWAQRSGDLLIVGLPVVFLLYLPVSMVPPAVRLVGSLGGLLVVVGTLGNVVALWSSPGTGAGRAWRVPLAFLALKAVTQIGILIPPLAQWSEAARLRVPYLHWLLLGFATLGLFAAAERLWGVPGRRWMTVAVVVLTATLMPLTGHWPLGWGGLWTLHAAASGALGPVVVAIGVLLSYTRRRVTTQQSVASQ